MRIKMLLVGAVAAGLLAAPAAGARPLGQTAGEVERFACRPHVVRGQLLADLDCDSLRRDVRGLVALPVGVVDEVKAELVCGDTGGLGVVWVGCDAIDQTIAFILGLVDARQLVCGDVPLGDVCDALDAALDRADRVLAARAAELLDPVP